MNDEKQKAYYARSKKRKAGSVILTCLLALVLTMIGLILVTQAATKRFAIDRIFDDEITSSATEYINREVSDYTTESGISTTVIDGLFTEDRTRADIQFAISTAYLGLDFDPDFNILREDIKTRMWTYLAEKDAITDSAGKTVITYTDGAMDIYKQALDIPGLYLILKLSSRYSMYLWVVLGILAALAFLLAVLCVRIQTWAHRGIRYLSYATCGAFVITLAIPLALYLTKLYERLVIAPQYVYLCVTRFVSNTLTMFLIISGLWLALTILLAAVAKSKKNKLMRYS